MFAIPTAGQSIDSGTGDRWLVHSVTRNLASTVLELGPFRPGELAPADRRFDMSLSDYRIFCTFSGIRPVGWAQVPSFPQPLPALPIEDFTTSGQIERTAAARTGSES
ncbi:MAG: hypothetical protein JWQ33_312 [Ramlibacter sp.]|nr:hypothetical protein [Ramlibacter sp.]